MAPLAAAFPPKANGLFDRLEIIVWHRHSARTAAENAVMHACMDQGIIDDEIVLLRQSGIERHICGEAIAEIKGGFRAKNLAASASSASCTQ